MSAGSDAPRKLTPEGAMLFVQLNGVLGAEPRAPSVMIEALSVGLYQIAVMFTNDGHTASRGEALAAISSLVAGYWAICEEAEARGEFKAKALAESVADDLVARYAKTPGRNTP